MRDKSSVACSKGLTGLHSTTVLNFRQTEHSLSSFFWQAGEFVNWINYTDLRFFSEALFLKITLLTLSGPGGAQRPGWPNSQLPIRHLLSYDAQTWWLLVFILETPFGHISAKLVNQGGCCCSFLIETSQKFWKWKIFPMLENCWNWHGGSILGREERFWT